MPKNESSVGCDDLNNFAVFFLNTTLDKVEPISHGYKTSIAEPQIGHTLWSSASNPAEYLLDGFLQGDDMTCINMQAGYPLDKCNPDPDFNSKCEMR